MQPQRVFFPHDQPNWELVQNLLLDLQERLLNETISAQDAALHIQVIYEAIQSQKHLDNSWLRQQREDGGRLHQGSRCKVDQAYLWYGMLKFLQRVDREESDRFLFTTLPNIIELALCLQETLPPDGVLFSEQQKGGITVLSRLLVASIVANAFLCLFPERTRDYTSKLNVINFTHFFKHLPQPSQNAKLQCILHYFERLVAAGMEMPGNIAFCRQVADKNELPTMDEIVMSDVKLCPVSIFHNGGMESIGSQAIQVDFANRSIGGGVLGRGRVQEEIHFCTCPELIAAMLFMENMEDNEAIVISGFERFSQCSGYAATLEFAGPFYDAAEKDASGNLLNTLCAIDATHFHLGGQHRQYMETFVMREINKAFVGFSCMEGSQPGFTAGGISFERDEEYLTAPEGIDEECCHLVQLITPWADTICRHLIREGLIKAAHLSLTLDSIPQPHISKEESLHLGHNSCGDTLTDNYVTHRSCSTPREDGEDHRQHLTPEDFFANSTHGLGGNGQRLFIPMLVHNPQNGSSDLWEADYSQWLSNFRRRSSQLSDLTSRRSSSSTKHSSEFSSDLEEICETLIQVEKGQHGIIEEEHYAGALSEFASHFVSSLMLEGTSTAAQMMPGLQEFTHLKPPVGIHKPQVVRPTCCWPYGSNGSSDQMPAGWKDTLGHGDGDRLFDEKQQTSEFHSKDSGDCVRTIVEQSRTMLSLERYAHRLVNAEIQKGIKESAHLCAKHDKLNSGVSDDVYRWFADKIVQEVIAHAVDDLYFQKFNSELDSRTPVFMDTPVLERTDSISSYSSSISNSSSYKGNADCQKASSHCSNCHIADADGSLYSNYQDLQKASSQSTSFQCLDLEASLYKQSEINVLNIAKTLKTESTSLLRRVEEQRTNYSFRGDKCDYGVEMPIVSSPLYSGSNSIPASVSNIKEVLPLSFQKCQADKDQSFVAGEASNTSTQPLASHKLSLNIKEVGASNFDSYGCQKQSFKPGDFSLNMLPGKSHLSSATEESSMSECCKENLGSKQSAVTNQLTGSRLSDKDLNLDYYRAAAIIVDQVFQSIPAHLSKHADGTRQSYKSSSSTLYSLPGRKLDSAVKKNNLENTMPPDIVSSGTETCMQDKAVMAIPGVSPRRTRSQSPCFTWLSKRLSRETLTNAFLKVENRPTVNSYERRSSEPCQRSVTLSLQAFNNNRFHGDLGEERRNKKPLTDDDLGKVKADSWRRSSLDSISFDRRRSSCGFTDPVLSRFAQELMNADTSVPQLLFVSSNSSTGTPESRRSSTSGFRDPALNTLENALMNSSFGQTPSSPRNKQPRRSYSRESRLWKSDSSETEQWFPIPRRVGTEFQEEFGRLNRHYSVEDVEDYADFIATTILQQAVSILHHDMEEVTQEDEDVNIFSENLADQILREGLITSLKCKPVSKRPHICRCDSEIDFSVSSNDLTARSLEDRLTDFKDALDVPYDHINAFAGTMASTIMNSVMKQFGAPAERLVPCSRPIATGNWGCGVFHGDHCLKMVLQWVAASLAHTPQLMYFTFGNKRLCQIDEVVDMLHKQGWTVGQLMTAVRVYCCITLDEMDAWNGDSGATAGTFRDVNGPSQTLFEFLLSQT